MKLLKGQTLARLTDQIISLPDFNDEYPVAGNTELDIRLGDFCWVESDPPSCVRVHTMRPTNWETVYDKRAIPDSGITLKPGQFILAEALERFSLPAYVQGMLTLRSWAAKSGLEQASSLILKAGWEGPLILELSNVLSHHDLLIPARAVIGQIQFFDISEDEDDFR